MTVLIGLAVILSALSIWGMMYALNLRGLDGVSAVVGNQTILNLKRVYTEFLNPSIESVQVITEHLRLGELSRPGFIASKEWLRVAFQLANQFGGSCYCGFANGSLFGYRLYSSNVSDLIEDRVGEYCLFCVFFFIERKSKNSFGQCFCQRDSYSWILH